MSKKDGEATSTEAPEATEKKGREKKKTTCIEDLPGIGEGSASKLRDAGYDTLEIIAYSMSSELAEASGIGEGTAIKAINAAREALEMGYESGDAVLQRRKNIGRITTGSKELDILLGGGVETQAITEAYGRYSSGKSQLAFQLSVNVQLPKDKGGLEGSVLFLDTENTFRPERIVQMAQAKGLDPETVLKHIFVGRSYNSDHQMLLVEKAEEIVKKNNVRLIIVDSLTSGFRSDYMGRGQLAERQQKLNKHLHALQKMADMHNVAVYVTNQVMDRPDILFGDPTAPIGGNVLAHQSTYRMYLRRSKEDRRIAKLVDSPNLPDGECVFRCTSDGLADME
ncbi:TPA: DNA repair and recombination protein RadA [Candidatus Micrarchaeota archaeon]|nr:MAG: DNA repair and recombination protein RadA [Candidatus Micrarchaeota archaeon CG1_02_51_15]HII39529.1 DNA repair and recombination protein RadA [Candidatus Micrarchaeota archaeon]